MELPPAKAKTAPQPTPEPVLQIEPDPPVSPPVVPAPPPSKDVNLEALLKLAGFALSARALLAVVLLGAFILAAAAMFLHSWFSLAVLGLYAVAAVLPLVALEIRKGMN